MRRCPAMRRYPVALLFLFVAAALAHAPARLAAQDAKTPDAAYASPGKHAVETVLYDWKDDVREREVPVKIYYPKTGEGPCPIVIFSHGLGGTREGYEYLGRHWASHGYVSVHLQHKGSDDSAWKGQAKPLDALRDSLKNPAHAINRPADVKFAINQVEKLNDAGPLKGRLDLKRIGMAGHSFGAYTTLAVAGEVFVLPTGRELSVVDSRIKAAIPMSSPVPRQEAQRQKAFRKIKIPCLHMTGTEDDSPVGDTKKEERRLPFDLSGDLADRYLVIFNGGDHMIFSGRGRLPGDRSKDERFQELIRASTLAFWDAYLREDASARKWFAVGGFETMMGRDGTLEKRTKGAGAR